LPQLISADPLLDVEERLSKASFHDGVATAPGAASAVKRNEQVNEDPEHARAALARAVWGDPRFQSLLLHKRMVTPTVSRYTAGMAYGFHIDVPLVPLNGALLRTDLAMTLFFRGRKALTAVNSK